MSSLMINYVALIVGLILIGLFWIHLSKDKSAHEQQVVKKWVVLFFVLGIVMFTVQYLTLGLG